MSLQLGIVGLPNVGKSTLFNALTNAGALVASYPFTTIEPNLGVTPVPDPRLYRLAEKIQPEKVVPAAIEFVDIAGLVRGAHQGEGLGNQFLGHIRNVDAVVTVARCFADESVVRVASGSTAEADSAPDPISDLEVLDLELVLADLAVLERRIAKVKGDSKAQPAHKVAKELAALDALREHLEKGLLAGVWDGLEKAAGYLEPVALVTHKPRLYVANVSEDDLPGGGPLAASVAAHAAARGAQCIAVCAQLEAELAGWEAAEADDYRAELGLEKSGLQALVAAAYSTLDLVTLFTTTGGRVLRAWPLPRHTPVLQAAGRIHTDMERGFIRAEVLSWGDFERAGSEAAARGQGLVRVEGREYVVQDGDICHIRFNV
jgi:hypothetical protein